jgi:hypothetical protein
MSMHIWHGSLHLHLCHSYSNATYTLQHNKKQSYLAIGILSWKRPCCFPALLRSVCSTKPELHSTQRSNKLIIDGRSGPPRLRWKKWATTTLSWHIRILLRRWSFSKRSSMGPICTSVICFLILHGYVDQVATASSNIWPTPLQTSWLESTKLDS